jgi:dTDP-glucose 4,6-dehydratase
MTILVTGAAGFIGSNFVIDWFQESAEDIVSLDLLTYAGNVENLSSLNSNTHHHFFKGNVSDSELTLQLFEKYQIRAVVNFAAESHVDRSIFGASNFIETNIVGTYKLLESTRIYWNGLNESLKKEFRFLHISSDEVYGSLKKKDPAFSETNSYHPNNPYSASKAASDHLVRAWHNTYGLPVLITHCSNNYGPYHFPDKLIPLCIMNALKGKSLPLFGDGQQIRDWIYVKDHCSAIRKVLEKGQPGENYNIGSSNERTNLEVVKTLCQILDTLKPRLDRQKYELQIVHIQDRPGHDIRYAIDATKIRTELGWFPQETFETGIRKTVEWYLANQDWARHAMGSDSKN